MEIVVDGPYFEDLQVGQRFAGAPPVTLTEGLAAAHQAIVGGRLPLAGAHLLSRQVLGDGVLAAPNLVWDVAIGQSTVATHAVVANLFYRGVVFHRAPRLGDTLRTVTEVVGLRQNSRRPGRPPTGLVALRISTDDQYGRPVLDFWRCAMLPLRDGSQDTGLADDLSRRRPAIRRTTSWRRSPPAGTSTPYRAARPGRTSPASGPATCTWWPAATWSAPRPSWPGSPATWPACTTTPTAAGARLVYGGHTIGLALHQAVRALPDLLTVVGWHGCDHLGPGPRGRHADQHGDGRAHPSRWPPAAAWPTCGPGSRARRDGAEPTDVLDWRFVAALA